MVVALLMLALTLIGFSDNLVTNVGQPSNFDPKFIVHGLFCLGWMILLVVQVLHVRSGNVTLHRRLGTAAMFVAAGVALSTLFVFWAVWKGWAVMSPEVKANRLLIPAFAAAVAGAYRYRWRRDWHMRFILVATFFMLGPILSRVFDPVLVPMLPPMPESAIDELFWIYFHVVWHGFFLSLLLHDWLSARRFHPVSIGGYGLFCLIWAVALFN